MRKKATKVLSLFLTLLICFTLLSASASAVNTKNSGSITLIVNDSETKLPINGIIFRLYKIADYKNSEFSYTDEFSSNGMKSGNFSDQYLPVHLMHYAVSNVRSYSEKLSENNESVVFSDLETGAYLIVSTNNTPDSPIAPSPFIISIPFLDDTTGQMIYDVTANPKIQPPTESDEEKTYITVKKQWEGNSLHPEAVSVTLLKNSEPIQTVELNESNNWHYRWDELDKNQAWSVVESSVPENYHVTYSVSQSSVVITNTYFNDTEETTVPSEETTVPDEIPEETTTDVLIDTGQLNWPVPLLSISGLVLFSIGWAIRNFSKKEEDTV